MISRVRLADVHARHVALQVQLTWDDDDPKRSLLKGDK